METSKVVYIAGRVSGLPLKDVKAKFAAKQEELFLKGMTVINPVASFESYRKMKMPEAASWTADEEWRIAMKMCLGLMLTADCLYLLPDWEYSRGAAVEHNLALICGLEIVYP